MRELADWEVDAVCGGSNAHEAAFWPQPERSTCAVSLTPRQAQCLAWVAAGKTTPAIAAILELSPLSVDTYVAAACRRLGVSSRAEAALLAREKNLLAAPTQDDDTHVAPGEISKPEDVNIQTFGYGATGADALLSVASSETAQAEEKNDA